MSPPRLPKPPILPLLMLAATMAAGPVGAQPASAPAMPAAQYGIREQHPSVGSLIRRDAVKPFSIPINRRYDQLTPEEKRKWNENYEAIAEGDEPPFPAEGLRPLFDGLRQAQAKLGVWGDLFVVATVDRNGDVQQVQAQGSPSPEMTRFAAQLLMMTKFKPAVCGGQPCQMEFPLRIAFRRE